MRLKISAITILVFLFVVNCTFAQVEPYLMSPTGTSIWVTWKTATDSVSNVEYGLTDDNLNMTASGSCDSLASDYLWHTVKLTNLTPDTRYYYRTVSGSQVSEIHRFRTQLTEGTNTGHFRFAIIGDHQSIGDDRFESLVQACKDKVIEKYATSPSDTLVEDHLNLVVFDGDQVSSGTLEQYEGLHFGQSWPLKSNIPMMTVLGNHEYPEDPNLVNYFGHFVYDDNPYKGITGSLGEQFYAFQVADVLFVMMNSNLKVFPDQYTWIEEIVAAADADPSVEWVFGVNHHCFYNEQMPGDGKAYVRDGYSPRLAETDKYVMHITGHAHLYARGSIRNHPCHVIINGGASWDQYWGETQEVEYQDVQKTIERQIFQIVDIDLDNREMFVETWSNGTNLTPGFREDLLIDTFYMKLDAPGPDKPSITNSVPENLSLPFTFEGSTYSGQEPFNSVEFQVTDGINNFGDPELTYKTDYENIFLSTGSPDYIPIDQNEGIDITKFAIDTNDLTNGLKNLRFRYRDQSLHWSDWSDTVSFNVMNGISFPHQDLVLRYKLDGDGNESMGSGLDGTPDAGVSFVTDPDLGDVADFTENGMITILSGFTTSLELPTEAISVSCWVKTNSTDDWGGFVGIFQNNDNYSTGWVLGTRHDHFSFAMSTCCRMDSLKTDMSIDLGEWYHVVGTYDGFRQKIYVNGELMASASQTGKISYPSKAWFQIGAYKDDDEDFRHDGTISDVLILDGAITSQDVLDLYNRSIPPYAGFNADNTNVAVGGQVQFTDFSQFEPESWFWSFEGGDPETSEVQNPTVTYNELGNYSVKLMVENMHGSDSLIKETYVNVGAVGIEKTEMGIDQIKIYPNPANRKINIEIIDKEFAEGRLLIQNSIGSEVYSRKIPLKSTLQVIDVSNFSSGIYFCTLINQKNLRITRGFIVE